MNKQIISVEYSIPGSVVRDVAFTSNESLLDADIIVFAPNISRLYGWDDELYAGKPLKDQVDSSMLLRDTARRRKEIAIALEHGKTVFLVMVAPEGFMIYSGDRTLRGTGRSSTIVNTVVPYQTYEPVPVEAVRLFVTKGQGTRIRSIGEMNVLVSYWQEFADHSFYEAFLDKGVGTPLLVTETGNKTVGGIVRFKDWAGAMVILPMVNFGAMVTARARQISKTAGSPKGGAKKAAVSVGKQFVSALVQIDKTIRAKAECTPTPEWAMQKQYVFQDEIALTHEIEMIGNEIRKLQEAKLELEVKRDSAGILRALLFETGTPLEEAVLVALRLLGFSAKNYKDAESEFDAVFIDPEGERLIGEAEGKNDKAINIDKLDQLERNIREEFEKQNTTEYAKGVLFANAFRLTAVPDRGDFFTDKCLAGAKRSGIALIRTPDLFPIAKYLKENTDPGFAAKCRKAIRGANGVIVAFPLVPKPAEEAAVSSN